MNWKSNSYESIRVTIDWLTKMVHYELIKIIINVLNLREVILDRVVRHHGVFNSIINDWSLVFNSKSRLSLCYFLEIEQKLSTAFL